MKPNNNKHLIEGLIALVLIIGLGWLFLRGRDAAAPTETNINQNQQQTTEQTKPQNNTGQATNQLTGTDSISVSNQTAGTKSVFIDNINLSAPGYVVISTIGANDKPDKVIGTSKLISVGAKQDLEIPLTTALQKKLTYIVQIYLDNGNKNFNANIDTLIDNSGATAIFAAY